MTSMVCSPAWADKAVPIHLAPSAEYRAVSDDALFAALKARIGLSGEFALTVGTLEPRKNHSLLFRAFAALMTSETEWHEITLVVIGKKGWGYEGILAEARTLGIDDHIIWADSLTGAELNQLYVHCLAFVMPSLYEGFGLPVLEAMACGSAVVVSDTPALKEIAGGAALTVDPYKMEDLVAALHVLVRDPQKRGELVRLGEMRARDFSWEKTARATLQVYADAIRKWDSLHHAGGRGSRC